MIESQDKQTRYIEMVETNNIRQSLARVRNCPGYDTQRIRRVLYHALLASYALDSSEVAAIRIAMKLP